MAGMFFGKSLDLKYLWLYTEGPAGAAGSKKNARSLSVSSHSHETATVTATVARRELCPSVQRSAVRQRRRTMVRIVPSACVRCNGLRGYEQRFTSQDSYKLQARALVDNQSH
jgi:hypothetical protein